MPCKEIGKNLSKSVDKEADVLYGVTMQEKGVSKLLELQSAELAAKMGLE